MKNYEYRDNLGNPRDYYDIVNDATLMYKEIDRLNNDIKTLLKENEAKEKVIKKQDYVINKLEKWLIEHIDEYRDMEQDAMFEFGLVLDKLKELQNK